MDKTEEKVIREKVTPIKNFNKEEKFEFNNSENIETLANMKVEEIESDAGELCLAEMEESLTNSENSISLDPEIQNEIKKNSGISEKLKLISERTDDVLRNLKWKMNQVIVMGMSMTALSGAGNFNEVFAGEVKEESRVTEMENSPEKYGELLLQIRESAINNDNENVFYIGKDGKKIKYLKQDGSESQSFIDFKEVDKLINNNDDVEAIHTHTACLSGFSKEEIKGITDGKTKTLLMPPSIQDISALVAEKEYFDDKSEKIKNKVVDPFGVWEYDYEKNNSFISLLKKFNNEFYLGKIIDASNLGDEEKILFKDEVKRETGVDSEFFNAFLLNKILKLSYQKDSSKISNLAKKIELDKVVKECAEKLKKEYPECYDDLEEIISNEMIIPYKTSEAQAATKRNLDLYQKHDINCKFTPFNSKE